MEGILLPQLQVKKASEKDGGTVQAIVPATRFAERRVRT